MDSSKRMTTIIMRALMVWGAVLAVGSTGYFINASLFDPRKFFVVAVCVTSFLVFWVLILRAVEKRKAMLATPTEEPAATDNHSAPQLPWSRAGVLTPMLGSASLLVWGVAIGSFGSVSTALTTILGWLAAAMVVVTASSGIVALSNPQKLRGKWIGLVGLAFAAGAVLAFVVRMTP